MGKLVVYGKNVIALLQEEKRKVVRVREDCRRTMRILKREDSPRRPRNVQQQMIARGGIVQRMHRDEAGERDEKKNYRKKESARGDR